MFCRKRKSIWNLLNSKELDEINFTKNTKNKLIIFKNILEDLFDVINENIFKIIELLEEIIRDIKNYELELRIEELESKFSKDLSETTFNELKELKNERKTN